MKLIFGADHGGFQLKEQLKNWAVSQGYQIVDVGAAVLEPEDDYPHYAMAVAEQVAREARDYNQQATFGIICCRSSGGITIAANRVVGVRAVSIHDQASAEHARRDNAANIITLSGDWLSLEEAQGCLTTFLQTPFSNAERHVRRLQQIDAYSPSSLGTSET